MGQAVQTTTSVAARAYGTPRLWAHAGMVALVVAIVISGSTGHNAQLNPLADQTGASSVLDQAAAADVAAMVATQTNLPISQVAQTTAQSLNAEVSLPTSDSGTLAPDAVVDTSGATAGGVTSYTVQPGDTLASIASEFDITTDTLVWANNLNGDNSLTAGQQLKILPVSGVQYTVQPGDTAQSIATHFQANADQILAFNNDQNTTLPVGQSIIVPDGVMPAPPAAATAGTVPASAVGTSQLAPSPVMAGNGSGYAFGYCTWYVATRRSIPGNWGNAIDWYYNAQASGYSVGATPEVGAIAWSGAGYFGHVAYVESVSGDNVTVSEMNWNGGWDRVDFRTVPASSFRYIY